MSNVQRPTSNLLFPAIIAAAAILAFSVCIPHGFMSFDDGQTIYYNDLIKNPTLAGLLKARIVGMYVPVSAVFYASVYQLFGEQAWAFHAFSVLLHAACSLAVFFFVKKLFSISSDSPNSLNAEKEPFTEKKQQKKKTEPAAKTTPTELPHPARPAEAIAFATALLFSVHPLKAEPICWIASQTTLTFSFFYIGSLTAWLKFRLENSTRWFWLSLLLFALAGLSKSAAVTLPLVLPVLDWFIGRIRSRSDLMQTGLKIAPFFIVSLALGAYTFVTRAADGAVIAVTNKTLGIFDRLLMVSHTLLFYVWKMLFPLQLTVNYPMEKTGGSWSPDYYLSPIVLSAAAYGLYQISVKKDKTYALAAMLYLLPLSIMLPIFSVGSFELRSDRYMYIPSIGVLLILILLIEDFLPKIKWYLIGGLAVFYTFLSFLQSQTWRDDETVFGNCVEIYPENPTCNCNLAYGELLNHNYEAAIQHYSKTLQIDPSYAESYNGRGQAYFELKKFAEANNDFAAAIKAGVVTPRLFLNKGKCAVILNKPAEAIPDLNKSIELEPKNPETYYFKGVAENKLGDPAAALKSYSKAIEINPNYIEARVNRGVIQSANGQYQAAIADFDATLSANPKVPIALSNRAFCYHKLGDNQRALIDASNAIKLQPDYAKAYEIRSAIFMALGMVNEANADLQKIAPKER